MATEITTWAELQAINSALDGDYILMNDLSSSTTGYADYAGSDANEGAGWNPIGIGSNFSGTFDGNGKIISDMVINRPTTDNIGLFSSINASGTIKTFGVKNASVTGRSHQGIVCAYLGGTAFQIFAQGTVSGNAEGEAGGAFGWIDGWSPMNGNATDCYANVAVSNSHASAYIGGFISRIFYGSGTSILRGFAVGAVSGVGTKNGFCGIAYYGSASEAYYDTQTCYATSEVGTGKTTAQMKALTTYPIYQTPTHSGKVTGMGYPPFTEIYWSSGDKFTGLSSGGKITVDGTEYTINSVDSETQITLTSGYPGGPPVDYFAGGNPNGWDIVAKDDFDPEDPSVWYIDDGNDYPHLWFEYEIITSVNAILFGCNW